MSLSLAELLINLDKSGNCPKCGKYFKGIKTHFRKCFFNQIEADILEEDVETYFDADVLGSYNLTIFDQTNQNLSYNNESSLNTDFLNTGFISYKNQPILQPTTTTGFQSSVRNFLKSHTDKLPVVLLNINSLVNKFHDILPMLNDNSLDILVLNETKLNDQDDSSFFEHQFYDMLRRDRQLKGGGGIIV